MIIPNNKYVLIPEEKLKIVSEKYIKKRITQKIPLWEGCVSEIPSKDGKYIIVELFNKYRYWDFYETYKYKVSDIPETKLDYLDWLIQVVRESKHYPLLNRCKGKFNENMLTDGYTAELTPIEMCNAMVEVS